MPRGPARRKRESGPAPRTDIAYQLKVTLMGIKPPVWRRIAVPDSTLNDLSETLLRAMGWMGYHLHAFEIDGVEYSAPGELEDVSDIDVEDDSQVLLSQFIREPKQRFAYTYDFGDNWEHDIVVEKILPRDPDRELPICTAGARNCPPEDVGSIWGYEELLKALADPKHRRHEELLDWAGDYDPEEFDLKDINARL